MAAGGSTGEKVEDWRGNGVMVDLNRGVRMVAVWVVVRRTYSWLKDGWIDVVSVR